MRRFMKTNLQGEAKNKFKKENMKLSVADRDAGMVITIFMYRVNADTGVREASDNSFGSAESRQAGAAAKRDRSASDEDADLQDALRMVKANRLEEELHESTLAWSIDEVHELEREAQEIVSKADYAALEAKNMKEFIERIPAPLRKHYQLPQDASNYKVVARNAEVVVAKVVKMLGEVKRAYIRSTLENLEKSYAKFGLEECLEAPGLLMLLSEHASFLDKREEVADLVKSMAEAKSDEDRKQKKELLIEMEGRVLREDIVDYGVACRMWEQSMAFAKKHHRLEPTLSEMRAYLALIADSSLREALRLTPARKFKRKIKPQGWRQDAARMFSASYRIYTAFGE